MKAISSSMGLGLNQNRPSSTGTPSNHSLGDSTAVMRPPSSGDKGIRLKRFRKKPP